MAGCRRNSVSDPVSRLFEELDYQQTQLGELILRRRRILKLDRDVVEVILNDEHLMSDMFTASEIALATIPMGLLETGGAGQVEVLVGGSGLDTRRTRSSVSSRSLL